MTLTHCPRCGTALEGDAAACGACGWAAAAPEPHTVVVTGETARSIGLRPSDETLMLDRHDLLLDQLRQELAGHYAVEKELGRGGMAVVYKAVETDLHRVVALKVLPPGQGGPTMAERFKREARMAASLDHPNIIPVYRVGQAAGTYFFAMKFVEGRGVDAIVESQGALPVPVVIEILRGAAAALAFAHERGIVHRDIKGANIMVDRDGRVLVSDFGIARAAEEKTLTATGSVIGTPHFMSPEQCSGARVAAQSDQYSLGVLAFQMLTGSIPYDADSLMGILQHHFFTPVPDIDAVRPGVPPQLIALVSRCMEKDAAERFASTKDLLEAIERVPFSDEDRREAGATLARLAVGDPIPKIRTGSLPPLQETRLSQARTVSPASSAPTVTGVSPPRGAVSPAPRARRSMGRVVAAGAVLVLLAAGGYAVQQQRVAEHQRIAAADSLRRAATAHTADSIAAARRAAAALAALPADPAPQGADTARVPPGRRKERPRPERGNGRPEQERPVAPPVAAAPAPTGLLRVSAAPPTAEIFVDNRRMGQGALFDEELPAGSHRLRITAPGYQTQEQSFTIEAGRTRALGQVRLVAVTP